MANPFTDPFNSFGYSLLNQTPGSNNDFGFQTPSDPGDTYNASDAAPPKNVETSLGGSGFNKPTNLNGNSSMPNAGTFGTGITNPLTQAAEAPPVNAWGAANDLWKKQQAAVTPPADGSQPPMYVPAYPNQLNPAYLSWLNNQYGPTGTQTPANPAPPANTGPDTTLPGTTYPGANPFGTSPFLSNPTATNPPGSQTPTTNYNQNYFPTQDTANTVAKMLGGTVGTGSMLSQGGGGFTQNQPNYTVTLKNGAVINPGFIAQYYQQYKDDPAMLARMIQSEANSAPDPGAQGGFAPFSYGSPTPGVTPNPITGATQSGATSADKFIANALSGNTALGTPLAGTKGNPIFIPAGSQSTSNQQAATPNSQQAAANTDSGQGNGGSSSNSNIDMKSLLAFLNAYSGLGGGAGNPTGINASGQLGNNDILAMLFEAMLSQGSNDQSLYSRQRQYPRFA